MENKVSIIIPVYNVESYLDQCVKSLLEQSYNNIEIILVDDGSTDNCPSICDDYARLDNRVIVIHKPNGGQSSARNLGLDIAKGDFVAFVDADDWVAPTFCEVLLNCILSAGVEVASCGFVKTTGEVTVSKETNDRPLYIFNTKDEIFSHLFGQTPDCRTEVWNKIYRREILTDIRFKEKQVHEEVFFDRKVFNTVEKLSYIDAPLYYYRINRPGSTNFKVFNENRLPFFDEMKELLIQLNIEGCSNAAERVAILATQMAIFFNVNAANDALSVEFRRWFLFFYKRISIFEVVKCPRFILFRFFPLIYTNYVKPNTTSLNCCLFR